MTVGGAAFEVVERRKALRKGFVVSWALLACLLVLVHAPAEIRAPVVIVFFCFVPGAALVGLFNPDSLGVELSLSIALSVAVSGLAGGILVYAQLWSPTAVVVIVAAISVVAGLRHVGLSRGERAELLRLVRALPANRGRIGPRGLPAAILQPAKVAGQKAPGVSGGIGAVPRLAGPGSPEVSPKLWFVGDLEPRLSSQSSDEPPSDTPAPRGVLIKGVSARTSIPIARRVLEDEDKKEWRTRLALEMIDALPEVDLEGAVVAADTGYGSLSGFRRGLTARGLPYLLRVGPVTAARELAPDGPSPSAAEARDVLQERIAAQPQPRVAWREPELVVLRGAEQILVCEGPNLGGGGTFWLSNLPAGTAPQRLALLLRLANRGRVERAASGPLRDAHK